MGEPVIFRGGPLAGEVRVLPEAPRSLRVPAFPTPFSVYACEDAPGHFVDYEIELYELHPNYGDGPRWQYIWVNPTTSLRARIRELMSQLEAEKNTSRGLRERLDDVAEDAANWRSLKALHAALAEPTCT